MVAATYADYAEIDEFEETIKAWRRGEVDDTTFRGQRLHMGTYGIRNSDAHMIRVKVPGGLLEPDHLDAVADIAEAHSRGFAHLTTRQNFHSPHGRCKAFRATATTMAIGISPVRVTANLVLFHRPCDRSHPQCTLSSSLF